jgi:hypothetical protein
MITSAVFRIGMFRSGGRAVRRPWEAVGARARSGPGRPRSSDVTVSAFWASRSFLGAIVDVHEAWTPGWQLRMAGRIGVSPASTMAAVVAASFGRVGGTESSGRWLGYHDGVQIWIWVVARVAGALGSSSCHD